MTETAETRSVKQFHEAQAWAERTLPNEFAPFAASAALTLQMLDQPVTAEAVLERLRAKGRDAAAMREKGWL